MKIIKLEITGYKNLDISLNFSSTISYTIFIGLNGSGKSNVIEAISLIFANLYNYRTNINFSYNITYQIKNYEVEIKNKIMSLIREDRVLKNKIITRDKYDYLPSEIITCYSGDEIRMWKDVYSKFYFSYLRKIKNGITHEKHKLVYINKYAWEIALVSLLCHNESVDYIKNILKIDDIANVQIQFVFPDNYESRKQNYIRYTEAGTEAQNDALGLIGIVKDTQGDGAISINEIRDIIFIDNTDNTKKSRKLFHLLYAVGSDKKKKLFEKININFNGITLKDLSEGEKKMILIKCIMDILANEHSLVLLDEPDSHVHVARKKEIISIIDKPNCFSLFTSHSPSLCQFIPSENIALLQLGINTPITDSLETARGLVDDDAILKLLFSTKDILLVEGKTDEKYITKAIEHFKTDYPGLDFDFIRMGGTDDENIESILTKITQDPLRKVIVLVDRDDAGMKVFKRIFPTSHKEKQNVCIENYIPDKNIYFLMIPHKDPTKQSGDFLIEDYFSKQKMRDITKQYIEDKFDNSKPFNQFPDVKKTLKKDLLPCFSESCSSSDMEDFKELLDKLKEIVEKPNN